MIRTGDKLICTSGNDFYSAGKVYTVGDFVNDKFFEVSTGCNDECWYATRDSSGIYIHFETMQTKIKNAYFDKLSKRACA